MMWCMKSRKPMCAECPYISCYHGDLDKLPDGCTMRTFEDVLKEAAALYSREDVERLYEASSKVEKNAYASEDGELRPAKPRILELMELCSEMGFRRIGLAFCVGLKREAEAVAKLLRRAGFEVYSVMCKCGALDKSRLVREDLKLRKGVFEAACNPVGQAAVLNEAGTDVNVIMGLCVGHDMLFTMFSKAPVTTLVVKDRVLGHSPILAVYSRYIRGWVERSATHLRTLISEES